MRHGVTAIIDVTGYARTPASAATFTSEDFRRWWADQRVFERNDGTKRLRHPVVGGLEIHYEAMNLPGNADQTLFVSYFRGRRRRGCARRG